MTGQATTQTPRRRSKPETSRAGPAVVATSSSINGIHHDPPDSLEKTALAVAAELHEDTANALLQITHIIETRGVEFSYRAVGEARVAQAEGGMTVENGSRPRTLGGVFFRIVRDRLTPEEKRRVFTKPKQMRAQERERRSTRRRAAPDPKTGNPVDVYLETLSPDKRDGVGARLDQAAQILGFSAAREIAWDALARDAVEAARVDLEAAGIRKAFAALTRTAGHALHLGKDWADDLTAPLKKIDNRWAPSRWSPEIHPPELEAKANEVIAYCVEKGDRKAMRDAVVLRLQYHDGLSPTLIASLHVDDYNPSTGRFQVHGDWWPVEDSTKLALETWLEARGRNTGRLLGIGQTGISPVAIRQLLQEYGRALLRHESG